MDLPEPLEAAVREHRLSLNDIGLCVSMAVTLAATDGTVKANMDEIAEATGASRRYVGDALKRLHAAGVISYRPTDTRFLSSSISFIGARFATMEQPQHQGTRCTDGTADLLIDDSDFDAEMPQSDSRNDKVSTRGTEKKGQGKGRGEGKRERRYAEDSNEYRLAAMLLRGVHMLDPNRRANLQAWADHMRLLVDRDGRSVEEVRAVINWLYTDQGKDAEFWRGIVLSARKLRDKFPSLVVKAKPYIKHIEVRKTLETTKPCPVCFGASYVFDEETDGAVPCTNCQGGRVPV